MCLPHGSARLAQSISHDQRLALVLSGDSGSSLREAHTEVHIARQKLTSLFHTSA